MFINEIESQKADQCYILFVFYIERRNTVLLKILPFIFLIPGFLTVFLARFIVAKYNLDKNVKAEFEHEMTEEEYAQYKLNKALVNVKMLGMLIALPGLALLILIFK
jgi:hypothetical protein